MTRERATWDEGWSGRSVHSYGYYDPDKPTTMAVPDGGDNPVLFYAIEDGEMYAYRRRERVGFIR